MQAVKGAVYGISYYTLIKDDNPLNDVLKYYHMIKHWLSCSNIHVFYGNILIYFTFSTLIMNNISRFSWKSLDFFHVL